jgi:hypothetical protein
MNLNEVRREALGDAGDVWQMIPSNGHNHLIRGIVAPGRAEGETAGFVAIEPLDSHGFNDRWIEGFHVRFDIIDDFRAFHEALRIGAGVWESRQATLPVGSDQTEGIPTLRSPRFSDPVPFKDEVINSLLLETIANREPSLAPADDDDGIMAAGS